MIILLIIGSIFPLIILYYVYQSIRNDKIYKIRRNWTETDDHRWYTYPYDYMLNPNKHNWFGLRYPRDKQFKTLGQ